MFVPQASTKLQQFLRCASVMCVLVVVVVWMVCRLCVVCTEHQPNPRSEWGSGILERMQSAVVGERVPTCGEPEPAGTHCSCERLAENQSDPSQDLGL